MRLKNGKRELSIQWKYEDMKILEIWILFSRCERSVVVLSRKYTFFTTVESKIHICAPLYNIICIQAVPTKLSVAGHFSWEVEIADLFWLSYLNGKWNRTRTARQTAGTYVVRIRCWHHSAQLTLQHSRKLSVVTPPSRPNREEVGLQTKFRVTTLRHASRKKRAHCFGKT